MPRYHFHIRHQKVSEDTEGIDLPDENAAWSEAVRTSGEALREIDGRLRFPPDWRMDVTDESGKTVFSLLFSATFYNNKH